MALMFGCYKDLQLEMLIKISSAGIRKNKTAIYTCIEFEMDSLSDKISERFFVPSTFRSVVCANSRVEWCAFSTLATETVALDTL